MGVYIKGMEMPTNCWECHFGHGDTGVCVVDFKNHGDWNEPQNCPLVPVPKHGRLIDADALKLSHCKECTLYPDKCLEKTDEGCDWESIYHIEHCAPTIIEAEEGET